MLWSCSAPAVKAHPPPAQALVPAVVASPTQPREQSEAGAAPAGGQDGAVVANGTSGAGRPGRRRNPPRQVAAAPQGGPAAPAAPPASEPLRSEAPPAEGDPGDALALALVPVAPRAAEAPAAPSQAPAEAAASPLPRPEAAPDLYASARQGSEPAEPHTGMGAHPERAGSPAADGDERAAAAPPEADAGAEEELSELEDEEVVAYLHQPEEVELRKVIWEELNREYTEQQEAKQRAADAAAAKARTGRLTPLLAPTVAVDNCALRAGGGRGGGARSGGRCGGPAAEARTGPPARQQKQGVCWVYSSVSTGTCTRHCRSALAYASAG